MPSDWSSLPHLSKNVQIKLYNRKESGRQRVIIIESDTGIKVQELNIIHESDGKCELPCEVLGIEGKKPVKFRFNNEMLEAGEHDEVVQQALKRTVFKMLEDFFTQWTIDAPIPKNNRYSIIYEIQSILLSKSPLIEISSDYRTAITWNISNNDISKAGKKSFQKGVGSILSKFFEKLATCVFVYVRNVNLPKREGFNYMENLTKLPMDPPSQVVDIVYFKNDIRKVLISFEFAGFPLFDDSIKHSLHRIEFSSKLESMRVDLVPKLSKSHYNWTIPHEFGVLAYTRLTKVDDKWMIDCAQLRVQELRRELTDSIKDYPKTMVFNGQSDKESKDKQNVDIMFLSTNSVIVQVDAQSPVRRSSLSGRFQVSPVTNAPPPSWRKTGKQPLHVDALTTNNSKPSVISPSESIDSGVASPGAISSDEEKRNRQKMIDDDNSFRMLRMRDRSASECYSTQQIPAVPGLKGILKKPKNNLSTTPPNGILRRSPASSRMLARSISECKDEDNFEINFLDESNDVLTSGSPPKGFFPVDEEDESSIITDSEDMPSEIRHRVKRVSFSEHVQARIYRSNSSIVSNKKKNEKRRLRRERKREESLSGSDTNLNSNDDLSISFEEDIPEYPKSNGDNNNINKDNSNIVGHPKRIQRVTSADSAYSDDADDSAKRLEMLSVA